MEFTVGMKVKPSGEALRDKRDYMHQYVKGSSEYEKRKKWYDEAAAKRGTITAIHPPCRKPLHREPGWLEVSWGAGVVSKCLTYLVEPAND